MTYGMTKSNPNSCRRLCMKTRDVRAKGCTPLYARCRRQHQPPLFPPLSLSLYTPERAPKF